jgi:hypothetical protein
MAGRLTGWRLAGIVFGGLAVLVIASVVWIGRAADRRWAEMERRVRELDAEVRGRDPARPPLRGEGTDGNAWDEYLKAVDETKKFRNQMSALGDFVARSPKSDRAKVEALLSAHAVLADHLRAGASRGRSRFDYDWESGMQARTPPLLACQMAANFSACRARIFWEEGKTREGAELLLDTALFGRDVADGGPLIAVMIGIAVQGIALDELRELVLSGTASREELLQIARELERLDALRVRETRSLLAEPLMLGHSLLSRQDLGVTGLWPSWRYGFSSRLIWSDAVLQELLVFRKAESLDARPWSELTAFWAETDRAVAGHSNSAFRMVMPGLTSSGRVVRERLAQLRLLRAAALVLAGAEPPEIPDPFGTTLRREGSRLWSLGSDGVDDGGKGAWKPVRSGDLVLEIPRR